MPFWLKHTLLHLVLIFLFDLGAVSWPRGRPHVGLVLAAVDKARGQFVNYEVQRVRGPGSFLKRSLELA